MTDELEEPGKLNPKKVIRGKGKAAALAAWNRFKSQKASDKLKMLVQATALTASAGALAASAAAIASANSAEERARELERTIATAPQNIQQNVDEAKASADEAKTAADEARSSVGQAQASADKAQTSANEALEAAGQAEQKAEAATPDLAYIKEKQAAGEVEAGTHVLQPGTYLVDLGATVPAGNSTVRIVFPDGRDLRVDGTSAGLRETKGILVVSTPVTVSIRVSGNGTFQNIFVIFQRLQ